MRAKLSGGEIVVHGDQWPMLVYANQEYDPDEPWEALFRNQLLVQVCGHFSLLAIAHQALPWTGLQAHLYLVQFSRNRGEGNKIRQYMYPWYDSSHYCILGIHSYAGMSGAEVLSIHHLL